MAIETLAQLTDVPPFDDEAAARTRARLDALAKPPGALGGLEELAVRIAGASRNASPRVTNARVLVFAGDHGVTDRGASAYPAAVTPLMVDTIASGRACVSAIARAQGAEVELVDVGVGAERRAGDITSEPAMTREAALDAMFTGARAAERAVADGVDLLAIGELGIGNTTPASALLAALLPAPAERVVGPGTGLDPEGVRRKIGLVDEALQRSRDLRDAPLDALAQVGGFEHAAMAGCMLAAAKLGLPVLLDGFVVGAAALVALRLAPGYAGHAIFATASAEPGHVLARQAFPHPDAVFDLGLRLGEASGAALAVGVARAACALLDEVALLSEVVPAG